MLNTDPQNSHIAFTKKKNNNPVPVEIHIQTLENRSNGSCFNTFILSVIFSYTGLSSSSSSSSYSEVDVNICCIQYIVNTNCPM